MPLRKIYMNFSTNVQTTPNVVFKEQKMGANPGSNPNPLIGWRKTVQCANSISNCGRVQEVFKNVNGPDCCLPRTHMIQNRADGVSGKIDKKYNHNYRQYLRKRCKLAYYDLKNGRAFASTFDNDSQRGLQALCCTTDCSGGASDYSDVLTYKRSNWGFRKESAVDTSLYISKMKYLTRNDCADCCPCEQSINLGETAGAGVVIGASVTSTASAAAGTIVNIIVGTFSTIVVKLQDCNTPFTAADSGNISVGGVTYTLSEVIGEPGTRCTEEGLGRRPQYPPKYPQDDPKSYNHARLTNNNL